MKLTKIASMVMTSATVLSTVAAVTQAKSQEGNAEMNGGKALPDTNHSRVGITFGKSNPNPNPDNPNKPDDSKGYLRLQHVPEVLDFGSHTAFNSANPVFDATGANVDGSGNDVHPGYAGGANQTPKLSTTLPYLGTVNGKTWVTVADEQIGRKFGDDKNNNKTGGWQLSVKADGPLTTSNGGKVKTIAGAVIAFNNMVHAGTTNIFGLTGNEADKDYSYDGNGVHPSTLDSESNHTVNLDSNSPTVQIADTLQSGYAGADVFAWDPSDIKLTLPANASVDAGTYTTSLTWTLSTGIQ